MESQKDYQINNKGKNSIALIVILLLLVLALSGYICYDKFILKETSTNIINDCDKENSNKANENNVTNSEEMIIKSMLIKYILIVTMLILHQTNK